MIVWKGWGYRILAAALVAGAIVATLAGQLMGVQIAGDKWTITLETPAQYAIALGVAGVVCIVCGWRFNVVDARKRAAEHAQYVRERMAEDLKAGALRVPPGVPPRSSSEAEAHIERVAAEQHAQALSELRMRHRVYGIRIQYIGTALLVGAVFFTVYAVAGAVG